MYFLHENDLSNESLVSAGLYPRSFYILLISFYGQQTNTTVLLSSSINENHGKDSYLERVME